MARTRRTASQVKVINAIQASRGIPKRAKTLAVKKSTTSRSISSAIMEDVMANKNGDACYLQLRSRRLEWRAPSLSRKAKKHDSLPKEEVAGKEVENEKEIASQENKEKNGVETSQEEKMEVHEKNHKNGEATEDYGKFDASLGDNKLKVENEKRKSTPSNLIPADSEINKTPTSSTTATTSDNAVNGMAVTMQSEEELEDFFTALEKKNIKRYNFDPVNDEPLPGRYEWVKLKP